MNTAKIYHENGIPYSVPPFYSDEPKPDGMTIFQYQWTHIETGRTGTHSLACYRLSDLSRLLAHWNEKISGWKYDLLPQGLT